MYRYYSQAKQDSTELQEQSKGLKEEIKVLEEREKEAVGARQAALAPMGNLVHDSVPISDDEVGVWGEAQCRGGG